MEGGLLRGYPPAATCAANQIQSAALFKASLAPVYGTNFQQGEAGVFNWIKSNLPLALRQSTSPARGGQRAKRAGEEAIHFRPAHRVCNASDSQGLQVTKSRLDLAAVANEALHTQAAPTRP